MRLPAADLGRSPGRIRHIHRRRHMRRKSNHTAKRPHAMPFLLLMIVVLCLAGCDLYGTKPCDMKCPLGQTAMEGTGLFNRSPCQCKDTSSKSGIPPATQAQLDRASCESHNGQSPVDARVRSQEFTY